MGILRADECAAAARARARAWPTPPLYRTE